jgi:hypothetical protein
MKHLRILALAAAPTALLISSAAPAPAANVPASKAPAAASSTCRVAAADEVLTAKESVRLIEQCHAGAAAVKTWHWMGNFASVHDVVDVANQLKVGPGGLVTQGNPWVAKQKKFLIPTYMFY